MNLEDDLRRALRRKPVPPDLTARVMDRVRRERDRPVAASHTMRHRLVAGLAAAAAIGSLVVGVPRYNAYQRAVEGERATREVMQALAITSEKLALVEHRLHDARR